MAKVSASASGQPVPDLDIAKSARATRAQSREPQHTQRRSARNAGSASAEPETDAAAANAVNDDAVGSGMRYCRSPLTLTSTLTFSLSLPLPFSSWQWPSRRLPSMPRAQFASMVSS
jgi:hypothetical protein